MLHMAQGEFHRFPDDREQRLHSEFSRRLGREGPEVVEELGDQPDARLGAIDVQERVVGDARDAGKLLLRLSSEASSGEMIRTIS